MREKLWLPSPLEMVQLHPQVSTLTHVPLMYYRVITVYVTISVAPVDYDATTVNFVFDADNSRRCVTVPIEDDDILEDTENFFGELTTTDPAVLLLPDIAEVVITEDPDDGENDTT